MLLGSKGGLWKWGLNLVVETYLKQNVSLEVKEMYQSDYFKLLLEEGEVKVPHSYVLDILCMLYDESKDAKTTKLDGNYTKMTLI